MLCCSHTVNEPLDHAKDRADKSADSYSPDPLLLKPNKSKGQPGQSSNSPVAGVLDFYPTCPKEASGCPVCDSFGDQCVSSTCLVEKILVIDLFLRKTSD